MNDRVGSAELVGTFEPGSPEWHEARANGLGGSEIAAVLGLSKWESPLSLWLRKANRLELPDDDNSEMEAGRRLESAICQKFADEHELGGLLQPAGTYRSIERPFMIANPDRFIYDFDGNVAAILEAKFALYDEEWGTQGTDEIPPYYLTQTRWYLEVFGLDTCFVEVFIGSQGEFREYVVEADPSDQEYMAAEAARFMASIEAGERPSIDGHDETYRAIRALHPGIERGQDVELTSDTFSEYLEALRMEKAAKTAKNRASSLVLDEMGDAHRALFGSQRVAYRKPGVGDRPPFLSVASGIHDKFPQHTDTAEDIAS